MEPTSANLLVSLIERYRCTCRCDISYLSRRIKWEKPCFYNEKFGGPILEGRYRNLAKSDKKKRVNWMLLVRCHVVKKLSYNYHSSKITNVSFLIRKLCTAFSWFIHWQDILVVRSVVKSLLWKTWFMF